MFWSKNNKEIAELRSKISNLELEIEKVKTHMLSLRGAMNRKSAKKYRDEDEDEDDPDRKMNLNDVAEAFGGQLPIELQEMQKYKNMF